MSTTNTKAPEKGSLMGLRGFLREAKQIVGDGAKTSTFWGLVAAAIFNRRARRTLIEYLRGAGILGQRGLEAGAHEVAETIAHGLILLFESWVALVLINLGLHWGYAQHSGVWFGWPFVIANFLFLLVVEHLVLFFLQKRVATIIAVSGPSVFLTSLKFRSLNEFWSSLPVAAENAGIAMSDNSWRAVRVIFNLQQYLVIGAMMGMFTPFAATGMGYILILPAMAALYQWKVNAGSTGNNMANSGGHVIDPNDFSVIIRRKNPEGRMAWVKEIGYKFKLAGFQGLMNRVMAVVIFLTFVASWMCFFIYRNDVDHDGLTNRAEKYEWNTNPLKADSNHDGTSDGEEVALGFKNPTRNTLRVDNPQRIEEMRRRAQYERDHQLWLRAVRDTARWKADSLKVMALNQPNSGNRSSNGYLDEAKQVNVDVHNFWAKVRHAGMRRETQTVVGLILLVAVVLLVASGFAHMFSSWWALVGAIAIALIVGGLLAALGMPAAMIAVVLGLAVGFGLFGAYQRRQSTAN